MAQRRRVRLAGFSLIELLITITVIMIVAMMGFPALMNVIYRSKIETSARQVTTIMQVAKLEAIKTGRETVVVIDTTDRTIQAYVNVDESDDRAFNPDPSKVYRTADYEIRIVTLPNGVDFIGPSGSGDEIDGFAHPASGPDMLIFRPNGSIEDEGAYRIADTRGNFLEARVSPEATAKIVLNKWDPDNTVWIGRREGDKPWKWY